MRGREGGVPNIGRVAWGVFAPKFTHAMGVPGTFAPRVTRPKTKGQLPMALTVRETIQSAKETVAVLPEKVEAIQDGIREILADLKVILIAFATTLALAAFALMAGL